MNPTTTAVKSTARTLAGTPVADLATEWGTWTSVRGGVSRTYPAARTCHGEILRAPKVDGSGRWVIGSPRYGAWTAE